jgi:hypothetical protein
MIKLNRESITIILSNFHCHQYIRHYIHEAEIIVTLARKHKSEVRDLIIIDWVFIRCGGGQCC